MSRLRAVAAGSIGAVLLLLAAPALGSPGAVLLVSETLSEPGFVAEDEEPAISANGQFVAYVGETPDPEEPSSTGTGIYLRDMSDGTTPIDVPHGHSELGIDFGAVAPSISADGRYVAFASEDPDISSEDRNAETTPAGYTYPVRDVFVYDSSTGRTAFASRADGPKGAAGNEDSNSPSISANGRYVAFSTQATNFLHGVYGGVYVRDLKKKTTALAGRASGRRGEPLSASNPSISSNGRMVAFQTSVGHGHGHRTRKLEIGVRDMKTNRTVYASRAGGHGALANADCSAPSISANGRYVAFATKATNLGDRGRKSVEDVFVRDLKTGRTSLVSRAGGRRGAPGDGDSSEPSISADGRYVAFRSYASNLGPSDNSTIPDVFVRDMRTGEVFLASRGTDGGPAANKASESPAISNDGHYVAFASAATNITPADTQRQRSIFRYQLLP